ncbi:hypothetical protein FB451DRAFT_1190856 [Mycena latifolia]|nr:hypothetical protein FB451DRAFT_1190856 [Mycena latifolia]
MWTPFDVLIQSSPVFWKRLRLDLKSTFDTVTLALRCCTEPTLKVEIDLRPPASASMNTISAGDDLYGALSVLKASADRWGSVVARVNHTPFLALLRVFLSDVVAPNLEKLVIEPTVADADYDGLLLCGDFRSVRRMRIITFPISWMGRTTFGHLSSLDIRSLSPFNYPSAADLTLILRLSSSTLTTLLLCGVGLMSVNPPNSQPLQMPALESIDLLFQLNNVAQTVMMTSVLALIVAPSLAALHLENCSAQCLLHVARGLPFVRTVTDLTIVGGVVELGAAAELMHAVPLVERLDLKMASVQFMDVLASDPAYWRSIRSVICGPVHISVVSAYVSGRQRASLESLGLLQYFRSCVLAHTEFERLELDKIRDSVVYVDLRPLV